VVQPSSKKTAAWTPVPYEESDIRAVQALANGTASPDEQRAVMLFIINTVAGTYDMSFRPESERDTCFAEGRRFVGLTLIKLLKLIPTNFNKPSKKG
jgi:hypothetical protein